MADITATLAPKSNQLDNIDLITGARVFTVVSVDVRESAEQPVVIHLAEFDRPWKPAVTMRRVLAQCWGPDSSQWVGRRVELFRDPDVTYGKDKPGGTRIRRISHIDQPVVADVMVSQGRMGKYTVDPLPDAPKATPAPHLPSREDVAACDDLATLQAWCDASTGQRKAAITARIAYLMGASDEPVDDPTAAEEQGELIP